MYEFLFLVLVHLDADQLIVQLGVHFLVVLQLVIKVELLLVYAVVHPQFDSFVNLIDLIDFILLRDYVYSLVRLRVVGVAIQRLDDVLLLCVKLFFRVRI